MDLITPIVTEATKGLVKRIFDRLGGRDAVPRWDLERLASHLSFVSGWSEKYQILGMVEPRDIEEGTVELEFAPAHGTPLTLRCTENDLISDEYHYMLVGHPGGGKTTTLKRLCRKLLTMEAQPGRPYQYPILIRVRDLRPKTDVYQAIADAIGLHYDVTRNYSKDGQPEGFEMKVGDELLPAAVIRILDATNSVLFIDGLDEAEPAAQVLIQNDAQELAYSLKTAKIVISVRHGTVARTLERVRRIEVRPLSPVQVVAVQSCWFGDKTDFLVALRGKPYADLANRPLFLAQLALLFSRGYELPPLAAEVYERIIRLCIEQWDHDQGVLRRSRYSQFGPDRKLKFLSTLSYELTYRLRARVFDRRTLVDVYSRIRHQFDLPADEAVEVAREIETHTGLVLRSSDDKLEFSHLSLQEYLCAEQIVREPFPERLQDYIASNPEPLAVATALSPRPDQFFAGLFLKEGNFTAFGEGSMVSYLGRVTYEIPQFSPSAVLGLAILKIYERFEGTRVEEALAPLLQRPGVKRGVVLALRNYFGRQLIDRMVIFARKDEVQNIYGFESPSFLKVPQFVVADAIDEVGQRDHDLVWSVSGTKRYPVEVGRERTIVFRMP